MSELIFSEAVTCNTPTLVRRLYGCNQEQQFDDVSVTTVIKDIMHIMKLKPEDNIDRKTFLKVKPGHVFLAKLWSLVVFMRLRQQRNDFWLSIYWTQGIS